jgi:hypothetical protein
LNPRVREDFIRRHPSKPIKLCTYGLLVKHHSITHPSHTFRFQKKVNFRVDFRRLHRRSQALSE